MSNRIRPTDRRPYRWAALILAAGLFVATMGILGAAVAEASRAVGLY